MNKKLEIRFENISNQIEQLEIERDNLADSSDDSKYYRLCDKIDKLEDKLYEIQCKIEERDKSMTEVNDFITEIEVYNEEIQLNTNEIELISSCSMIVNSPLSKLIDVCDNYDINDLLSNNLDTH